VGVFTYRGKPIKYVNTRSWRNALVRAGIENFRWHDLHHTWASLLAQQGTSLNVLKELGGWESQEMVNRYAHLSDSQLMSHSETLCNVLDDTILAQTKQLKSSG
jgi:integrase